VSLKKIEDFIPDSNGPKTAKTLYKNFSVYLLLFSVCRSQKPLPKRKGGKPAVAAAAKKE
jgi:hypothetical protein